MSNHFSSGLYKAKNMGPSGGGVHHWWLQRLTAIFLLPLTICLIVQVKYYNFDMISMISQPYNFIAVISFVITVFYHAKLGMQVIIEDYVSNLKVRFTILILVDLFIFITIISTIIALAQFKI